MNLQHQAPLKSFEIIKRDECSWWVSTSELGNDGRPLPYGRVVYFARNTDQARAWVERASQPDDPAQR